jgi:hypothetical protein
MNRFSKISGFCVVAFIALVSPTSLAESIHGIVSFEKVPSHLGTSIEEIRVSPVTGSRLAATVSSAFKKGFPIETSILIRETLGSLQAGDFVVLSGQYFDQDQNGSIDSILVNGIESVGLKRLIRTWKSDKWAVMKFENFNRMILYRPDLGSSRLKKLKELNYTLAPDQGSDYSILMVEARSTPARPSKPVFAGKLTVEKDRLQLELFDTKSGLTAEVYSLSPL